MRKLWAVLGSILFFFLAPGIVAFLIPWLLADPDVTGPLWLRWIGAVVGAMGLLGLLECFARFALVGLGTPAPVAPTKHLVVSGLYRYVRNPMYVTVLGIVLAQAMWFASLSILGYAMLVWLTVHLFVAFYEEPTLRRTYGDEYRTYCENVGRWIPRASPWSAKPGTP
jgi:protein-S-isoprenylcysteine O-methyltransferase Ste14